MTVFAQHHVHELLLDHAVGRQYLQRLVIGLVWTLCQGEHSSGLAMSPHFATRTLPWSGRLQGQPLSELTGWVRDKDLHCAAVGLSAINACLVEQMLPDSVMLPPSPHGANLTVFEHFLPQLRGRKVAVIGHYPGIERYREAMQLSVLELQPQDGDLPASAAEFILPESDWVFLTASSLVNKTFARLAELSIAATTVLMGPSLPWLPQWHEFGIDYLAGVEVLDPELLFHTVAQGGGVRIFEQAVRYRIATLNPTLSMVWLRSQIAECAAQRVHLLQQMEDWYASGNHDRFPDHPQLEAVAQRLSRMDTSFKQLWDHHHASATQD
jgi:Uncharacterized conserved protein